MGSKFLKVDIRPGKKTLNLGQGSTKHTFDLPGQRPTLWALNLGAKSNIVYIAILYNSHTWTFDLGKTNLELGLKVSHMHLHIHGPSTLEKQTLNLG
jgi:hypothetical protein